MSDEGYLFSKKKEQCFGCEACVQACNINAIKMLEDEEGFRYPVVNESICVNCQICHTVCPYENMPPTHNDEQFAFGGYSNDEKIRQDSTSGGAFSSIVNSWCDNNYVIFGAVSSGLDVYHTYITDKNMLGKFRKSKYAQSKIGYSYVNVKKFLLENRKVVFSGTPCHIAGLKSFLGNINQDNLLTIEVICEGIPSPWYIRKYNEWCIKRFGKSIESLDYRFKDGPRLDRIKKETNIKRKHPIKAKWDFQVMCTKLEGNKEMKVDRWFNPFWSIWLNHLMSRPSCYSCPFASSKRNADITLGDLWGVHIYCPDLYGRNGGSSLIICNTKKGKNALDIAKNSLFGHEIDFETALKYQSPMRKTISYNPERENFMRDLVGSMEFQEINNKWAKRPSIKLLWQKYIWGNRQKVAFWNIKQKLFLMKGIKND